MNSLGISKVVRNKVTGEGDFGLASGLSQIKMADLDYSKATLVRGTGFRFLIPVPALGEENKEIKVKDWEGKDQVIHGYSFLNPTDGAQQAVAGDGKGILIVSLNPDSQDIRTTAMLLLEKVRELGGTGNLKTENLDKLLTYIHRDLGIVDTYNSDDKSVSAMVPVSGLNETKERPFGLVEKQQKPGPKALYVAGSFTVLDGPHGRGANYPDGFIAIKNPEGFTDPYISVSPEAIKYCYALEDGTRITDPKTQLSRA